MVYTLYTLDIGKLDQVMKKRETLKKLTDTELSETDDKKQDRIVYVDDMHQNWEVRKKMLQTYIQQIYKLTVAYFKTNLLLTNYMKTEMVLVLYSVENKDDVFIMT